MKPHLKTHSYMDRERVIPGNDRCVRARPQVGSQLCKDVQLQVSADAPLPLPWVCRWLVLQSSPDTQSVDPPASPDYKLVLASTHRLLWRKTHALMSKCIPKGLEMRNFMMSRVSAHERPRSWLMLASRR